MKTGVDENRYELKVAPFFDLAAFLFDFQCCSQRYMIIHSINADCVRHRLCLADIILVANFVSIQQRIVSCTCMDY